MTTRRGVSRRRRRRTRTEGRSRRPRSRLPCPSSLRFWRRFRAAIPRPPSHPRAALGGRHSLPLSEPGPGCHVAGLLIGVRRPGHGIDAVARVRGGVGRGRAGPLLRQICGLGERQGGGCAGGRGALLCWPRSLRAGCAAAASRGWPASVRSRSSIFHWPAGGAPLGKRPVACRRLRGAGQGPPLAYSAAPPEARRASSLHTRLARGAARARNAAPRGGGRCLRAAAAAAAAAPIVRRPPCAAAGPRRGRWT